MPKIINKMWLGFITYALLTNSLNANDMLGSSKKIRGEKSGLFVGISYGTSLTTFSYHSRFSNPKSFLISANVGLKVGYAQFFFPYFGIRGYFSYDFNAPATIAVLNQVNIPNINEAVNIYLINADAMVNFVSLNSLSVGVFIGCGVGYALTVWSNLDIRSKNFESYYGGFNVHVNFGTSVTIARVHRIEVSHKLQTVVPSRFHDNFGLYINPYIISVGYSYTF